MRAMILSFLENCLLKGVGSSPSKCPIDSPHRATEEKVHLIWAAQASKSKSEVVIWTWLPEVNLKFTHSLIFLTLTVL